MLIKHRYFLIVLFAIIPLFLVFYYFSKTVKIQQTNQRIHSLQTVCKQAHVKQQKWQQQLHKYHHADPFFIQNTLEKLSFLEAEKKELKELSKHAVFKNNPKLKQRLNQDFASLKFKQKALKKDHKIIESEEINQKKIELNNTDLMRLLSLVEDLSIDQYQPSSSSPQLIIQKFILSKTPYATFQLDLNLYKREFLYE